MFGYVLVIVSHSGTWFLINKDQGNNCSNSWWWEMVATHHITIPNWKLKTLRNDSSFTSWKWNKLKVKLIIFKLKVIQLITGLLSSWIGTVVSLTSWTRKLQKCMKGLHWFSPLTPLPLPFSHYPCQPKGLLSLVHSFPCRTVIGRSQEARLTERDSIFHKLAGCL